MALTFPSRRDRLSPCTPPTAGRWVEVVGEGRSRAAPWSSSLGCLGGLDEVHRDRHRTRDRVEDGGAGLGPRHDLGQLFGWRVALDAEGDADRLEAVWHLPGEAER